MGPHQAAEAPQGRAKVAGLRTLETEGWISQIAGVAKTEWSWSCLLSDFDNDGNRDLFVANGYRRDVFDGDVGQKLTEFAKANRSKYSSPMEMLQKDFKGFIELYEPIKLRTIYSAIKEMLASQM